MQLIKVSIPLHIITFHVKSIFLIYLYMLVIPLYMDRIADKSYYVIGNGSTVSRIDTNRKWYFKKVLSFA